MLPETILVSPEFVLHLNNQMDNELKLLLLYLSEDIEDARNSWLIVHPDIDYQHTMLSTRK